MHGCFQTSRPIRSFKKGKRLGYMRAMSISLPMCSVDFMDTSLSMEEQAIADHIQDLKKQLGDDLLILGHHYQRDSIVTVSYTHLTLPTILRV